MSEPSELDELIASHLDGALSEAERARFNFLLRSDPTARNQFARILRQETLLSEVIRDHEFDRAEPVRSAPLFKSRAVWASLAAIAATIMLIAGLFAWRKDSPQSPLANLQIESGSISLKRGSQVLTAADSLQKGDELQLAESASASITYGDGTRLDLGGGSQLVISEGAAVGKRLRLLSGTLSATVTPQPAGEPLVIGTPEISVTVVGTRFRISARGGESTVHVTEGRVRIASAAPETRAIELSAGQFTSARADSDVLVAQNIEEKPALVVPQQSTRPKVLMVVADPIPFYAHDVAIRSILQELNLDVVERNFDKVAPADLDGIALIVLPSHKCQRAGLFTQTQIPVIAWHNVWHQDLGMSDSNPSASLKRRPLRLNTEDHTLTGGLKSADPVFELLTYASAKPGKGTIVVVRAADADQGPVIFAYEKGALMNTLAAPARRVGFSLDVRESSGRGVPVDAGALLLKAAVRWCLETPE